MCLSNVHAEDNLQVSKDMIKNVKLDQLTTAIESKDLPFLQTTPIPLTLVDRPDNEEGILTVHLARASLQAKALNEASKAADGAELEREILFSSHQMQILMLRETSKNTVVRTWNYAAAQVTQLTQLTNENEASFENQWKVSDASDELSKNVANLMKKVK
ncbi:hypothetical protein E3Q15_03612 [Wallemia mellicola]|nr:hypothetical protein E3Q15_03612 [Wallemia mellicola]TIC13879.1 hypothetical protein E3Q13_03780 [Wallemia mellicola]TIC50511.1 hypothetical protein E3Q05_03460 [Wallemia mellicola]